MNRCVSVVSVWGGSDDDPEDEQEPSLNTFRAPLRRGLRTKDCCTRDNALVLQDRLS